MFAHITCSRQVFVFPILQSPPDVAQIFWTCQLHTAWQLLHDNGGSEHPAVSWGWIIWKWQQRTTTRLLGAHCRHSPSEVARQCEAVMSGKSVPHQEETGELETRRPRLPRLYIYSLESNQGKGDQGEFNHYALLHHQAVLHYTLPPLPLHLLLIIIILLLLLLILLLLLL